MPELLLYLLIRTYLYDVLISPLEKHGEIFKVSAKGLSHPPDKNKKGEAINND